MSLGIIGKKIGMTRVFTADGESCPVTVVEATPNRITQIKTVDGDGYDAVQVTTGSRRKSRVTKAMQGHFAKAKSEAGRGVWEFRLDAPFAIEDVVNNEVESDGAESDGDSNSDSEAKPVSKAKPQTKNELTVTMFAQGQKVDVTGRSIGKGFSGVVKRFGMRGGRATHGNSKAHRSGGSIGNAQDPGRVFKGKKMAGQMGGRRRVQQGLEIIRVDAERNLLLISGSIPGSKGTDVIVCPAVKSKKS